MTIANTIFSAVCTPSCENGGTCTSPNTCTCQNGWSGDSCTNGDLVIQRVPCLWVTVEGTVLLCAIMEVFVLLVVGLLSYVVVSVNEGMWL